MAVNTSTHRLTMEERIDSVVHDGPDLLYKLSRLNTPADQPIEIVSELPAATDLDIILGYVTRWVEVQQYFNRDLRIYAWSYTVEVEKYILSCTQQMSHIAVTVLPFYLKENKTYGE